MRGSVFSVCLLSLALAGCEAAGNTVRCEDQPEDRAYFNTPQAEQTMEETLANMVQCLPEDRAAERAQNIGVNADERLRGVLAALYRNDAPDAGALNALQGDINLLLRPKEDRFQHTTLLNEAVRQANYTWVNALLQAGADPNASGSLMAYTVLSDIRHPGAKWNHLYPDGSPAVPFLQAYLDNGGQINTTAAGGFGNAPLIAAGERNLDATVFLLKNGADGWLQEKEAKARRFSLSYFGGLIFGARAPDYNEELYAIVERGLFQVPKDQVYVDLMHDTYLEILEEMENPSGPTMRHELWTLQRVVNALIAKKQLVPSARMTELLAEFDIPDEEGGWVLKAGTLHQDHDDARIGAVLGTEIW